MIADDRRRSARQNTRLSARRRRSRRRPSTGSRLHATQPQDLLARSIPLSAVLRGLGLFIGAHVTRGAQIRPARLLPSAARSQSCIIAPEFELTRSLHELRPPHIAFAYRIDPTALKKLTRRHRRAAGRRRLAGGDRLLGSAGRVVVDAMGKQLVDATGLAGQARVRAARSHASTA